MPELPEVETAVRALRKPLVGRRFTEVRNYWPRHIAKLNLATLQQRLHGRSITAIRRRGKYLLFDLDDGQVLIIHLRMTGHLAVADASTPPPKHLHTIFALDNGRELRFRDQRKFGKVYLVDDEEEVVGKLGPEPLAADFAVQTLRQRLNGRTRVLKPLLLDQTFVAGLGNIYADEALFYAGIHPERRAHTLDDAEIAALHASIQKALRMGVAREGASIDIYVKPDGSRGEMQNALNVYKQEGKPCPRCGATIQRIVLSGRSTHFCPDCQS